MFLTPIELVDKQIDKKTGGFFYAAKAITNQKHVEKIEKWAQTIFAKKGGKYIDHPSRVMGLTALHVAVIAGKPLAVELFLRLGARLSVQDSRGWTPMHHAAMQEDDAILGMLSSADIGGVAGRVKNNYGGTWQELRQLAFPGSQKPADDAIVFHYENDAGEIVEGTTGDFERLTGAKFAYQMFASPEFFNHQWANPPRSQPPSSDQAPNRSLLQEPIQRGYEEFKKNPPTLYLKKTPVGHGVFAKEEIPNGTIVTAYLGEALIGENRSDYRLQKCDGEKVRNLGPMINDGLPNVAHFSLDNLAGLPSLHLFRSMKKISPGDQLLFSYGEGHTVKYEKYINFAGKEAVIEEYKDSSLKEKVRLVKASFKNGDVIELMNEFQMLDYLLSSPLLQLELLLEEILSIDALNDAQDFIPNDAKDHIPNETMRFNYEEHIDLPSRIAKVVWKVCDLAPDPQLAKLHLVSFLDHLSKELPQHFAILCFDKIIFELHETINKFESRPPQLIFDKSYLSILSIQKVKAFFKNGDVIEFSNGMQTLDYLLSSPLLQLKLLLEGTLSIDVLNGAKDYFPIETMRSKYKEFIDMSSRIADDVWKVCDSAPDPQLAKLHLVSFLDHLFEELPQQFAISCFDKIIFELHETINKFETRLPQQIFDKSYLSILSIPIMSELIRQKFTLEKEEKLIAPEHALRRAAYEGDLFSVTFLIENGFVKDPHSKAPRSGKTALNFARARNHLSVVQFLENR